MEGSRGSKKDWSEMSASRAMLSGAVGERSARRVGAWLRWAREERSSRPSDFTSSWVRAPDLDFRFLVPDAVADDDFAMAAGGARVRRRRQGGGRKGAKVVPITLDQVYMLKAEGIAFRFLPDPLQIKNALQLKSGLTGFDGVPVFQSDLLVVKKQKKRYCPVYFQKEDIERELRKASKSSKGSALSKQIMVGSLEDVLKKMEINDRNSGWDDLIFIPPGKSLNQHINEVSA